MATKVTLYMDEGLLAKAKLYSKRRGKSLSRIVSDYLELTTEPQQSALHVSDRVKALRGILPESAADEDVRLEYLTEKYLCE
jgi:hypothetical protein